VPVGQPDFFEDIVSLVIQPPVEAIEISEVMRIEVLAMVVFDQSGNFRVLFAHAKE
jgi:hypothetical protein